MRAILLAVIAVIGLGASPADAASLCPPKWCGEAEALVQRWFGSWRPPTGEILHPPPGIDPRMALLPPKPRGTLRVIRPPAAATEP